MADKNFGVRRVELIGSSGTPNITSPNNLNLNANTVAISTDLTIGGQVNSDIIVAIGQSIGIGSTQPTAPLDVKGTINADYFNIANFNVTGILTASTVDLGISTLTNLYVSGVSTFNGRVHALADVGINTESPTYKLELSGERAWFKPNETGDQDIALSLGKKIGSNSPFFDIETSDFSGDNVSFIVNNNTGRYRFKRDSVTGLQTGFILYTHNTAGNSFVMRNTNDTEDAIKLHTDADSWYNGTGNLGIGTDNPGAKLEVRDGNSQGIIVRSNSTQATDTNKALRVRNNSDTNTFHVSHKGQGFFAGSVGIGTDNPGTKLEIAGTGSPTFRISDLDGTNQFGQILANNGTFVIESRNDASDGQIIFRGRDNTGTNEYARFDENGNLGIGSDNPIGKLDVVGHTEVDTLNVSGVSTFNNTIDAQNVTVGAGVSVVGILTASTATFTGSDAVGLTTGTTAQRPASPDAGMIRYNTQNEQFEGYSSSWGSLGGASGAGGDAVFYENDITVSTSYTITAGKNAMSAGPITVSAGATVTIPSGSVWTIV